MFGSHNYVTARDLDAAGYWWLSLDPSDWEWVEPYERLQRARHRRTRIHLPGRARQAPSLVRKRPHRRGRLIVVTWHEEILAADPVFTEVFLAA